SYDFLKIPPDWELAKIHAKSRETKPENGGQNVQEICQCCGYELNRTKISLMINQKELGFLGAGFPLFYNYLKYCIIMLLSLLLVQGIPNMIINGRGNFCHDTLQEAYEKIEEAHKKHLSNFITPCASNFIVQFSIANLIGKPQDQNLGVYFSIGAMLIQIILSIIFRKEQNKLEAQVDENNITPADFSIMVSNIPKNIPKVKEVLKNLFSLKAVIGIAIISFETEQEKDEVLEKNKINYKQRLLNFFKGGLSKQYSDSIYYIDRHLYIQQAPEPNDIDWEFINVETSEKVKCRFLSLIKQIILMLSSFSVISLIAYAQAYLIDHAYQESLGNHEDLENNQKIKVIQFLNYMISFIIVFYNKFFLPYIVHHIVDCEKWSTKTKLNISYARKLSLALFNNTALITFIVEIIFFNNYYGIGGGMIYSEYYVFILNAFIPALAWIIDPWSILKNYKRKKEVRKGNQSSLTQLEANLLMEFPDYTMGKRYADVMKTMWFTFFFSPVIPQGTVWSIVGVFLYYFTDKYNLIFRRTVKESIGKQLTMEMINLLEYCIVFHTVLLIYILFNELNVLNIVFFVVSAVIVLLPMQKINDFIFPVKAENETLKYSDNILYFDTDYDRENPVLRQQALEQFYLRRGFFYIYNYFIFICNFFFFFKNKRNQKCVKMVNEYQINIEIIIAYYLYQYYYVLIYYFYINLFIL
ncbi:hypothetical protein IMG5_192990, partial [Ichthyophthirius multifiliis]